MSFIDAHFLLQTRTARRLYKQHAEPQPILDYHCHLSPRDVASDRQFQNLFEIWLEGDHYKWRAMRTNGIPERLITGDAAPYEKFLAWARTVPQTVRNPLYHWTHLELQRYFGITQLLNERTAPRIWAEANAQLARPEFSAHGILNRCRVAAVCTTDDPADDLAHHQAIAKSGLDCKVYPTFRPDKAMMVHRQDLFQPWLKQMEKVSDMDIRKLDDLKSALKKRHDFFHAVGGRLSDHGLERCCDDFITDRQAAAIFAKARAGKAVSPEEQFGFASHMMLLFGHLDAEKGWTKQIHFGALRNNNTRKFRQIGPDTGFDSIGDWPQARALSNYLDRLDQEDRLPRVILYNLNPASNYVIGTMIGNFQDGTIPGKVQFGSGWWFLDQKEGMEWQLNTLSNLGLLSRFVGMLTDSRSFLSYPRHEYFRRTLCNLIGRDVENGEIPDDEGLLGPLIENICFHNARQYLNLPALGTAKGTGSRGKNK
jgi:glucuronate isomerase